MYKNCPEKHPTTYHDFERTFENDEAVKEVCVICNRREIYRKKDGQIDNRKYLRDHIRDFCQPTGSTRGVYLEVYGAKRMAESLSKRDKRPMRSREEREEDALETLKIWKRLEGRGFTDDEITENLKNEVLD
jgi:hypothetical protein